GLGITRVRDASRLPDPSLGVERPGRLSWNACEPQSLPKVVHQGYGVAGLGQIGDRSAGEHAGAGAFVEMPAHEDDRDAVSLGNQPALQIGPAHTRQLHIADETGAVAQDIGPQVLLGRGKRRAAVTGTSDELLQRLANAEVIIDDRNQRLLLEKCRAATIPM